MAKDQNIVSRGPRRATPVAVTAAPTVAAAPRRPFNPVQFLREVRVEWRKVTWTSWKETWITSVMVGIMVVMTAVFFFGVDEVLSLGMRGILKLANAD
jgi:preprotein translocase subunit SecE